MTLKLKMARIALQVVLIMLVISTPLSPRTVSAAGLTPCHLVWYQISAPQKEADLVFREVNRYLKAKINATIELRTIDWKDYERSMAALIASGDNFDICFTSAWANNYVENAVHGAFLPLDSLLHQYGKGILREVNPILWEGARLKGKIYGIPANKELAHQSAVIFNQQYLNKYGLDPCRISCLEDLEPLLKTIKAKESGSSGDASMIPYAIDSTNNHWFSLPFDRVNEHLPGALYYDNRTGYKIINDLETPEYQKYLTTMRRWYLAGYMPEEAASLNQLDEYYMRGNWFASFTSYTPHDDMAFNIRFGYPVKVAPLKSYPPVIENRDCRGSMMAISATSKNPERAMMFLNLLNTDPYLYNLIVYGIAGRHYLKKPGNLVVYPQHGITQYTSAYALGPFTLGNMRLLYRETRFPKTFWEDLMKFSHSAVKSPLLGFNFDPTPVSAEITALLSISREFEGPLNTGAVDPKIYLSKALAKYKAAGLNRVIAEEQRQLDLWCKQKKNY